MTLKIVKASQLRNGVAINHAADGAWSEPVEESRAAPTAEEVAAPFVIKISKEDCGGPARKADVPTETDAEPESTVCAAYWAY